MFNFYLDNWITVLHVIGNRNLYDIIFDEHEFIILEQKDKKKKFRPLEKMRKFFKSSKKSTKTKDSVKAKSTGALHKEAEQSEDDDDGG